MRFCQMAQNFSIEKMDGSIPFRRFPGPAGILQAEDKNVTRSELISANPNWKRMIDDRSVTFGRSETLLAGHCAREILTKFNIQWFTESKSKCQIQRSPLISVVVKSLNPCILVDQSGYIYGMLDSDVEVKFGSRLQPGSGKKVAA